MPGLVGRRAPVRRGERGTAWLRGITALAFAGLTLAGCSLVSPVGCGGSIPGASPACSHGPTGAPGGLSRDAAIAAARRVAPPASADPAVVWASIERDPFAPLSMTEARLVWKVRLQGSFAVGPCPSGFLDRPASSADAACLDGDSGLIVVLDYFSGALVGWDH